jgi:hypothetical protein
MNWIDFKKERPEAKPVRLIWVKMTGGGAVMVLSDCVKQNNFVAWAENEGTEIESPTKPDPCENAWADRVMSGCGLKSFGGEFQAGWDAAIKWKEGQK